MKRWKGHAERMGEDRWQTGRMKSMRNKVMIEDFEAGTGTILPNP
jgi:hypothetical protein